MDRLTKILSLSHGKLFYTQNGTRYTLARCSPELRFYEKFVRTPASDHKVRRIIRHELKLILGEDTELCQEIDEYFLENTVAFSMCADVYRPDGIYETIHFDRLDLEEASMCDMLCFSVACPWALANKLQNY